MEYPLWVWIFFFSVVLIALFVDVGVVNRKAHTPTRRETFTWSVVWISLALLFNLFIFWQFGINQAKLFLTGYLIELSLSVDNLFVFLLIFTFFKVPKKFQHRVLFWGIIGALVMRMVMIFAGAALVERFHWILYIFGAFLIYTGIKMFSDDDEGFHPEKSPLIGFITRFVRISKHYDGDKFIVTDESGRRTGTLLLLVLITVELSDLIFAVDSIPAIFGITTDKFIVYTSNIFAILGLRTFFFLLADLADRFHFLKYGLGFVLSFIGAKMLLPLAAEAAHKIVGDGNSGLAVFLQRYANHEFEQEIINISLGVVVGAIVLSIVLSLIFPPKPSETEELLEEASDQPPTL